MLGHNICCLIQSRYELGIEARFWTEGHDDQRAARQTFVMDDIEAMAWV